MAKSRPRDKGRFYSQSKEDVELILKRQTILEETVTNLLKNYEVQRHAEFTLILETVARTQEAIKKLNEQSGKIAKILLNAILDRPTMPQSMQEMVDRDTRNEHQSPYIPHEEKQ